MDDNKLHIVPMPSKGQKHDPSMGRIVLNGTENFYVTIKEYKEVEKKIKILEDKKKQVQDFARQKWMERAKAGWSEKKLKENYEANMKVWYELDKQIESLQKKYNDVNWSWQLVGEKLDYNKLSHNKSFNKGIAEIQRNGSLKIHFDKVIFGGGMAWLEAYHEEEGATGKIPYGVYVQGYGKPEVLDAVWTDFEYNPIIGMVGFESKVILHIYTSAMYGQKVEISLMERNWRSANKEVDISGMAAFVREVTIMKGKDIDNGKNSTSGLLTKTCKEDINTTESKVDYVQKIEVEVLIDSKWDKSNLGVIDLYPRIKVLETGAYFEEFPKERCYLKVNKLSRVKTAPIEVSNKPSVVHTIETNVGAFHPCKYTGIELRVIPETKTEKKRVIFKENNMPGSSVCNIPIICADTDHFKNYSIKLMGLETEECRFHGKSNDHKKTSLNVLKIPENYQLTDDNGDNGEILNFKAAFNYHPSNDNLIEKTSLKMLEYIWPVSMRDDNNHALELRALSCRYDKRINVIAYPDVKWTLDFRFGMKGPEQLTHTNLPTYPRNSDKEKVEEKPQSRHSDSFEKAQKAGQINTYGMAKRENGMELEFQLVLKAEYNKGEEIELAEKYAQKIKKFLELLLLLKEGLDTLTNIDKINSGHKRAVKGLGKFLKSPIVGTIDYPAISVGAKWQAAIKDDTNEIYTDGKIVLRFNPLLKGDVSLDIIAAISYVPAFGQVVKAIEIALNTAGAELNFMLTIFGQVNVEFEYALAEKGGSNLNLNGELGLKLVLSGKVKVNLNAIIFSVNGEIQAEAYAVTSIKPKASIGHDNKGTFVEAKCDFMGINIVCIITAKGKNNQIQYKDTYNLFDRKDDFVKGKKYLIES
ncbi:hypothetical protein [Flavobacterium nitrogenifigens]|uniref:Uncharacterized protein n=1 Tax=Flavobacterium nitrogenifigens TaxID=1617283 RepID=A0A521EIT5_9FLAO|nr:hypothetical protein [Flavobacterium nitrogenifigens]KAF2326130.1 hypothetical protein DM397_23045 [Flavobacterium nitrogenifigens]SMO83825.1 hypothetical protein SAMN06265220_104350 [Flavobacterium nitrogenifigens]